MTAKKDKAGTVSQDDETPNRCTATNEAGEQCWFVEHDDSIEHVYDKAEADRIADEQTADGDAAPEAAPEPTGATEPAADGQDGADGPEPAKKSRKAVPASRESVNAWWCSVCDTASPHETTVCPKCGTPRKTAG